MEETPVDKYELIPFDEAWEAYQALTETQRLSPWNPTEYRSVRDVVRDDGVCPVCHFRQFGFVRLAFPPGHPMMGKAICCPRCWPAPFGHAVGPVLSTRARKIAALWKE